MEDLPTLEDLPTMALMRSRHAILMKPRVTTRASTTVPRITEDLPTMEDLPTTEALPTMEALPTLEDPRPRIERFCDGHSLICKRAREVRSWNWKQKAAFRTSSQLVQRLGRTPLLRLRWDNAGLV
jgi:hypothetical protein